MPHGESAQQREDKAADLKDERVEKADILAAELRAFRREVRIMYGVAIVQSLIAIGVAVIAVTS